MPARLLLAFGIGRGLRNLAVLALAAGLLLAGVFDEALFAGLGWAWQVLLATLHLDQSTAMLPASTQPSVTRRPLLPGLSYAGLYIGACLLLLRLLLPQAQQWRVVLRIYGGVGLACGLLLLLGKVGGNLLWAYRLGRHLLDFLVSPVPVLALVALLRGAQSVTQAPAGKNST